MGDDEGRDDSHGAAATGQEIAAMLAWYRAMGADEAIGEVPMNAFEAVSVESPPRPEPSRREDGPRDRIAPELGSGVRPPPVSLAEGPSLEELRIKAGSLAELQALVALFEGCSLRRTAKSLCFSRGSETAKVMVIGEAPGRDEDLQGRPFVGRAGQLLDKMLAAIGLDEESTYITNTVYWRPPGNRTPTPQEIASCAPFLTRQIELVKPELLLLLGGAAASTMLETSQGIMRLRGKWRTYEAAHGPIPVMATLHPAFLLRNSSAKRQVWQDLLLVKQKLAGA